MTRSGITDKQLTLPFKGMIDYSLHSYAVGQGNEHIWQAIEQQSNQVGYYLKGVPGCGRTHLAHALADKLSGIYISPQNLTNLDIADANFGKCTVVIDDFHMLKSADEEIFFHLFNAVKSNGKLFICLSRDDLDEINIQMPDLSSRLKLLQREAFLPPDDILLGQIIVKVFSDHDIKLDEAVLNFLVARLPREYEKIQSFCLSCIHETLREKKKLTIPLVTKIFQSEFNLE
tara:strand:- start:2563 stop:3255 length:693 start_codon:yes stop_codon:yes gene_type:complete